MDADVIQTAGSGDPCERALAVLLDDTEARLPDDSDSEAALSVALGESRYSYQIDWKITNRWVLEDLANKAAPEHRVDYAVEAGDARVWAEEQDGRCESTIPRLEDQNPASVAATVLSLLPDGPCVYRIRAFADGDAEDLVLLPREKVRALEEALGARFDEILEKAEPIPDAGPAGQR